MPLPTFLSSYFRFRAFSVSGPDYLGAWNRLRTGPEDGSTLPLKPWRHYGMMQRLGFLGRSKNLKGKELDVSKPQLTRRGQPPERVGGEQSDAHFPTTEQDFYRYLWI